MIYSLLVVTYNRKFIELAALFFSSKILFFLIFFLPFVHTLLFISYARIFREINYWYLTLISGQSSTICRFDWARKKRVCNTIILQRSSAVVFSPHRSSLLYVLGKLKIQILPRKDKTHVNETKFSKFGNKFYILRYCDTYKIDNVFIIQGLNSFYIDDICLLV